MNILILSTHLDTGGITSYISTLARGLVKNGHRVLAVTSGGDRYYDFLSTGAVHVAFDIRTKSELSHKIFLSSGLICDIIKKNHIDIIHAQTRITQVLACLLHRRTRVPYVATCHGFYKLRLSRKIFPCWGQATIAISEAVGRHLQNDFLVPEKNITVIPNGIDVDGFTPLSESVRRQQQERFQIQKGPVIGIIGRLADIKGHAVLIQAMSKIVQKFSSAQLCIFGQGKQEGSLKKMTVDLRLDHCIRFFDTTGESARILPLFDVAVVPSLDEGFGLSVLEAQASLVPVVASRVGGIPGLIEHRKTGLLVSPRDAEGLADAIISLLSNRAEAETIAAAARVSVEKNFSADLMVSRTEQFYQKVMPSS